MKFDVIQHLRKKAEKDINAPCVPLNQVMTWKRQSYLCVQAGH